MSGVGTARDGFVYLLSNPSMPGMVKIGRTTRDPARRAGELAAASGVPTPFVIEGYVRTPDAVRTEAAVHRLIGGNRVNQRREFFRIEPARALAVIRKVASDELLVVRRPSRKSKRSSLSVLHIMAVIAYFNVALAVNGFDFAVLWKAAAVNACFAILVPARLWNRTMREFQRRPMMTHVVVATTLFASAAGWYHLAAPHFEAMLRSSTL